MLNDHNKDFNKNYYKLSKEHLQSADDLLEQIHYLEHLILGLCEITDQIRENLLDDDLIGAAYWLGELAAISTIASNQINEDKEHDPLTP